ncbi:structural protein [Cellulophaga phage phi47:1]|nr:hypothetical protein CHPG_00033 [Cellulophaga phage phi3:1]AGF91636.1 hypothetical protein CDPG_00032 [Cellulophaga phage phi47:1]AGO47765.1 structural protein [Cellulophaga phage phi3ST:2]AGO48229.1 structural protein [Cellulophaga phage phiSM]AGO49273.1 structural protein [Cellulophaga phage phi38:2]
MISFSRVSEVIIKNYNKILKVTEHGTKTPDVASSFGDDSSPLKDMVAIFAKTQVSGEDVVIGYLNQHQIAEAGEKRIFSVNQDNTLSAEIHLKSDNQIVINKGEDWAVKYSELEKSFNQLRDDLNTIVSRYNSHVHSAPNGASTPLPLAQASTVTIDAAKSSDIRLP